MSGRLRVILPGRVDYLRAYALQRRLVDGLVADRSGPGALIVLEHPSVITLGRSSKREHVLASDAELARRGVQLVETDRGGDVTWHGPGQLVAYPILPLERCGERDLGRFLRLLEETVIRTLAGFGIPGRREPGASGVWTDRGKISAMGVAFRRWVSFHGISLNHDPDMADFGLIVPCGLAGRKVATMRGFLGGGLPEIDVVARALIGEFCTVFDVAEVEEVEVELPEPVEPLADRRRKIPLSSPLPLRERERVRGSAQEHTPHPGPQVGESPQIPSPLEGEGKGEGFNTEPTPHPRPLPQGERGPARRNGHPSWLVKRLPADGAGTAGRVGALLDDLRLNTVCRSAHCPNLGECFASGTATFLAMGPACTRRCRFCAVDKSAGPAPLDPDEPRRIAEAARRLALAHVVVTAVTRDDLPDGGAAHLAAVARAVRAALPGATVELLVPDFAGSLEALRTVLAAGPEVLNHNVETVPRLYPEVRPGADYHRSLELLSAVKRIAPRTLAKSGLMAGLGERPEEVREVLRDLARAGVGAVTVGQYLAPSPAHLPVAEFVRPEQFEAYAREARALGIAAAECGPWVRSSYHAGRTLTAAKGKTSEEPCASK